MLPPEVQALLEQHAPHFSATPEGKVKCELNGHTFPAKADALQAFINGKKYAKLAAAAELEAGLERYEPFIVPSKNLPGALFCALTGELLNARAVEVKQHLKGKKFQRAQARFQADEQELLEEPDMKEGSDMEEDGPEDSEGPGVWLPEEVLREYEMGEAEAGEEAEEATAEEGGAGGEGAGDGPSVGAEAEEEEEEMAEKEAPAKGGKASKAKGKAAGKQQKQKQKQQQKQKGATAAAAEGGAGRTRQKKAAAGGEQQKGAATNGAGGSSKAKAPRAKKARTG